MEPNQNPIQNQPSNSKTKSIWLSLTGLVLIIAGLVFWNFNKKDDDFSSTKSVTNNTPAVVDNKKAYKDGTYSAVGTYNSPAGPEEIGVTLVIAQNKITDAILQVKATNEVSNQLQVAFGQGFKQYVVGKSVNEVALTVVNGASLTPLGFMDALEKIKVQSEIKA